MIPHEDEDSATETDSISTFDPSVASRLVRNAELLVDVTLTFAGDAAVKRRRCPSSDEIDEAIAFSNTAFSVLGSIA